MAGDHRQARRRLSPSGQPRGLRRRRRHAGGTGGRELLPGHHRAVRSDPPGEPREANLVSRAVEAFCRVTGRTPALSITLTKTLPVAAGLGGGSADAAATLRLLERLQGTRLPESIRRNLALELGADVPACLENRPLHMTGIGEQLALLPDLPDLQMLLVNPGVPVSTGAIFRLLAPPWSEAPEHPPGSGDADTLLEVLSKRRNDLEAPACTLAPEIAQTLGALRRTEGCALARMSGSGATCFAIYRNHGERAQAAEALRQRYPNWWIA
ncbi:4-(cytidine 5'-diphospho)-2-C-methyl-D-erythritol kinase [Fodinicurvata halophila]|uniref:4-(cytidine 5'-diphospho)-2-C-methyl-D-erythritol kinase n=1 Tax=Fodinicurvata halophila TaxID=1419723 RepID=UPI00363AE5FB